MKNFLCILAVIFLFSLCFLFGGEQNINKDRGIVIKERKEEVKKEETPVKKEKEYKAQETSRTVYKVKKFTYPSFIKKGNISLYLNNPTLYDYPSSKTRVDVCKLLISKINSAQNSIDFAVYGFDNQDEIISAMKNARARGVNLRGVMDSNEKGEATYYDDVKLSDAADIVYDNSKKIMHNKFFIIDDKFLMTGSMNISKTGCGGYNSNSVFVIEEPEIISAYKKEFEQMHNGIFKQEKANYSTPLLKFGDTSISVKFSPKGNIYSSVIGPAIKNAKKKIRMSIFVFTYNNLIEDLIEAKKRGVDVVALIDATSAKNYKNKIEKLKEEGIKVKIENWGGKNHEKTISVDDDILIIGSANFSYSGLLSNDENVVYIKNKEIASFYNAFFDKLYDSIDNIYLKYYPHAEGTESGNSCKDGIDNDFDGKIDAQDEGCVVKNKKAA